MMYEIDFEFQISPVEIDFEFDEIMVIDADPYEGPYLVIPKTIDQVLATKNKTMRDDVTVTEIPYAETSNIHGTTVVIAS